MDKLKLSLRAIGLLTVLEKNPELTKNVHQLHKYFNETEKYIGFCVKELLESGEIKLDGNRIMPQNAKFGLVAVDSTLEGRIYRLYDNSRLYGVIAWFLGQLDKTFDLDVELTARVNLETKAASVVQFWSDYNIEQAMKRALVEKSLGNVTLEDLRELLVKKDKGEIVW